MIRKLDIEDISKYLDHLTRVYDLKGLMSADDPTWVEEQRTSNITYDNISSVLSSPLNSIWGEFDSNDNMIKSLRSEIGTHQPVARLINFKSESTTPFNPVKSLLPMLDIALKYYESKEIYSFFLLRRLDWFSFRRNTAWEDKPPLDRYNSYYDEIIESGQESKHPIFRLLAGKIVYPMKTAVVQMCLKQEYRTFGQDKEIYLPITKAMEKMQSDKNRLVYVIGVTPQKLGDALCKTFENTGSKTTPISRNDIDFSSENWQQTLLEKIPKSDTSTVIVLNLFDHSPGKGHIQEQIFDTLWANFKLLKNIQIVVIGSMAHYHDLPGIPKEYTDSKRNLRNKVVGTGRLGTYNCKLLMLEPGVIESLFIDNPPAWECMYFKTQEFADRILSEVDSNSRFSFVMANGSHLYSPDK